MLLNAGHRLGVYEITTHLGSGGMGEVYRARDTRLQRDVAIKVLPDLFTQDPGRLARFEREAQMLASLNHPHIAGIYGVEDAGPVRGLVLELVEGPTLAECIARSPLAVPEALAIAAQIADALEAAHTSGIVHRDLKPANIKVRPDGSVKVLDFGLAKVVDPQTSSESGQPPTITAATQIGMILGTARYMAPEQARGSSVDKRADVWAFGCVIYEMLTGRAAFPGGTITETLAAVLERDPDWSLLPASTPPAIHRLLRRSLQKDPRRRLRDAADARLEIDDVGSGSSLEPAPAGGRRSARGATVLGVGFGVLMGAVAALSTSYFRQASTPASPDFSRIVRLTSGPDREVGPAISPDGKWVAYVSDREGSANIWVKFIAGGDADNLTARSGLTISSGTGIGGLEISPDGTRIAVMARPRDSQGCVRNLGDSSAAVWYTAQTTGGQPSRRPLVIERTADDVYQGRLGGGGCAVCRERRRDQPPRAGATAGRDAYSLADVVG